ncbi:MAG: PadR family transcriptional regulator [Actinomycetota bacterium]|nr:PadR family transcriptional regulator [Actinomycetota bacterium]
MHAHAIHSTPHERCGRPEEVDLARHDLAAIWRAMTGAYGGGRGRHRHRAHGLGPSGGFPLGPFGPAGGPFGRSRKARRGDIRTAALLLLAEEPRNGYQIMQEVEERSDGVWRPSPGSVYPALAQLEDEGLIRSQESESRKLFALTDAGQKVVRERDADAPAPWEQMSSDISDQTIELGKLLREVAAACAQVMRTASEAQRTKAAEVLTTARRELYRILADGDAPGATVQEDA